jgi:predicted lipoprotein with Yx(FWY)xxD motif
LLAAICLLATAAAAPAAVSTIGQVAPDGSEYVPMPPYGYYGYIYHPPQASCSVNQDLAQPLSTYTAPVNGKEITAWRTNATTGGGQEMTFKVFRRVGESTEYEVVGRDGPRMLTPASSSNERGHVNSFSGLHIPVQPGDLIGLYPNNAATVHDACMYSSTGSSYLYSSTNLADTESAAFASSSSERLNVAADVFVDTPGGPAQHTLTIAFAGGGYGTVQSAPAGIEACNTTCSHAFDEGTHVTLTATPDSYSSFGGWSGGGCSGSGSCELTIGADTTVTAAFNLGSYVYPPGTYGEAGGGGAAVGSPASGGPVQVKCTRRKGQKKATCRKTKVVAKQARNATLGKRVLTATNGHTFYSLSGEHGRTFLCTESCLTLWPPLKAPPAGVLPAGPVKLGTVSRPDGAGRQVTYHGRPLYVFGGDSRPGDVYGQGLQTNGGTWSAVLLPAVQKKK